MSTDDERNIDAAKSEAAKLLAGERKIRTGNCLHCGAEFQGTGKRKYCSPNHRQAASYARIAQRRQGQNPEQPTQDIDLEPPRIPSGLSLMIDLGIASLPLENRPLAERLIGATARQILRELKRK